MQRCREVNEYSNAGWAARDVRESCIRMEGHLGKHRNHRWEWESHGSQPTLRHPDYSVNLSHQSEESE